MDFFAAQLRLNELKAANSALSERELSQLHGMYWYLSQSIVWNDMHTNKMNGKLFAASQEAAAERDQYKYLYEKGNHSILVNINANQMLICSLFLLWQP